MAKLPTQARQRATLKRLETFSRFMDSSIMGSDFPFCEYGGYTSGFPWA